MTSPGENIPVTVEPALIDNLVPTEDEIAAAVKELQRNRSGGPSRIRAEHIKGWLAAAGGGGGEGEIEDRGGGGGRGNVGKSGRNDTDGFQGR